MNEPKILFIDIETLPNILEAWGLYEQSALDVKEFSIICCFSAKWYKGKQLTKALPDYPGYKIGAYYDSKIVQEIWQLLDEADIVCAHNGDNFDIPTINARFAKHNLTPPSTYKTIDTIKTARKVFRFGANSLDRLCQYLGLGRKLHTGGYELWQGCMAGDMAAWAKMKKYNAHDVVLLEKLYVKLLPWIPDHPNYSIYTGITSCPKCGSTKLQSRGVARSITRAYRRFCCQACGGWSKSSVSEAKSAVTNA